MSRSTVMSRTATALLFAATSMPALAQSPSISYEYDANDNLTKVTDALAHVTRYSYDALNRRSGITDPETGLTRLGYDGLDQLNLVTDPRNLTTRYTVDGAGNQTALASPDTGNTTRTYDEAGNLKTSVDAKGQTTSYQYDVLNRLTSIIYADASSVAYRYDQGDYAKGRLMQIVDASGSTEYSYDLQGRVTREVRSIAGQPATTEYRYDTAGRLAGIGYPSGRSVEYQRDVVGRISSISTTREGVQQMLVSQVEYQPFGPVRLLTFGNGKSSARSQDLDGRTTSFTLNGQRQAISHDAASRVTAINDAGNPLNNVSYGYDSLDRLTTFLTPETGGTYAYDAVGNRITKSSGAADTTYAYAADSNRLTQVRGSPVSTDANGSIVASSSAQFSYDARGRLVSASTAIGVVQYQINGLGQRVQKITPTGATIFYYDLEGKLIGERSGQNATDYVYLGDLPVAVVR
jgi:YD repeat-containing protein